MQGSFKNKLQHLEVAPPPAVWDKIAATLDSEFVAVDSSIASRLESAEIDAPFGVWEKLQNELAVQSPLVAPVVERRRIFSIGIRTVAAAAVVVGLIAFTIVYFFNTDTSSKPQIVNTVPANTPAPASPRGTRVPEKSTQGAIAVQPSKEDRAFVAQEKKPRSTSPTQSERNVNELQPAVEFSDAAGDVKEAPIYELATVSALQPVSVSAPPIRDTKGNLILDVATISQPNEPYITVTGPNGKQTRISSKFLSCLGYMNAGIRSSEMDARAIRCNLQFEEWRNRLLSEPGFIPTANNFFDIFELKDLLQEM